MDKQKTSKFLKKVICAVLDGYLFSDENPPRLTIKAFLAMQGFRLNDDGVVYKGDDIIGLLEYTLKSEAGKPDYVLKMTQYAPIVTFGVELIDDIDNFTKTYGGEPVKDI